MPTPATNTLDTIARKVWLEKQIYNQTLGHIPFFAFVYSKHKRTWSGGNYGAYGIEVDSPASSIFIRGSDPIPLEQADTKREAMVMMNYQRKGVKISWEDVFRSSDEALIDAVTDQVTAAANRIRDDVEQIVLTGDELAGQPAGVDYAVDDGTLRATYLQLSRILFTSWRANVVTPGADQSMTYSVLENVFSLCLQGKYAPDLILTTRTLRNTFAALVAPIYRINIPAKNAELGYQDALVFNGLPVMFSEKVTDKYWYVLNCETFRLFVNPAADWTFTKFDRIPGTEVYESILRFDWSLVCVRPRGNGKHTRLIP